MYHGKKLMVVSVKGQYEQKCNAAALQKMGITVLNFLQDPFEPIFRTWMNEAEIITIRPDYSTHAIVSYLMHCSVTASKPDLDLLYPEWVIG